VLIWHTEQTNYTFNALFPNSFGWKDMHCQDPQLSIVWEQKVAFARNVLTERLS